MKDILAELSRRITKRSEKSPIEPVSLGAVLGNGSDPITAEALYPRWANFLKPGDILVAETGTSSMGLGFALMPAMS
jgi:indolepyruvate decarboxylase